MLEIVESENQLLMVGRCLGCLLISAMLLAGGCASAPAPDAALVVTPAPVEAFDCKKVTGQMQVRILQIRGFDASKAQGSTIASMFGAKSPADRYAAEKAWLEASNAKLAEKNCATFDLAKELSTHDNRHTPIPTPPAIPKPGDGKNP